MPPQDLNNRIDELKQEIEIQNDKIKQQDEKIFILENKPIDINRFIGVNSQKIINEIISTEIHNSLWDNISFTSSFATASISTVPPSTAELLDANGRESDTSLGRRFKPERECRFKTTFYINSGLSVSTIYITAPAVLAISSVGTAMIDANKSYVGVKIVNGSILLVSSVAGTETTQTTTTTISDTTTNLIEIDYYVSHATVLFNNVLIGNIPCNLQTITLNTFCPFLTSVKSSDGTAVNLIMEAYEFLQKRK